MTPAPRTIIAVTTEDDRHVMVVDRAASLAIETNATVILYDLDAESARRRARFGRRRRATARRSNSAIGSVRTIWRQPGDAFSPTRSGSSAPQGSTPSAGCPRSPTRIRSSNMPPGRERSSSCSRPTTRG
jgi:hypothetical protein